MLCHSTLADGVLSSSSVAPHEGFNAGGARGVSGRWRGCLPVRTPAVVPAHDPEQLLARGRIEGPLHLQPAELEQGDLGEREDAAALLEVPAEGAAPVAERQVAVDVVVGDDARHADDLHAARRTAVVEATGRERGPEHAGDGQIGQAPEAGEDDAVADAFPHADLAERPEQEVAGRQTYDRDLTGL